MSLANGAGWQRKRHNAMAALHTAAQLMKSSSGGVMAAATSIVAAAMAAMAKTTAKAWRHA